MSDESLLERITLDPAIMAGQPIVKGTRLTVVYQTLRQSPEITVSRAAASG